MKYKEEFFKPKFYSYFLILLIFLLSVTLNLPKISINKEIFGRQISSIGGYSLQIGNLNRDLKLKKGLDIDGGVRVTLKPDLSEISEEDKEEALASLKSIVETRVNRFGVNEPVVRLINFNNNYSLYVEIPGIDNVERAVDLVGTTAKLSFRLEGAAEEGEDNIGIPTFDPVDIESTDVKRASVEVYTSETGVSEPSVKITFNSAGADKFSQITKDNIGKRLGIFLDEFILIAPVINSQIPTGEAFITGGFDLQSAQDLAIQINSGALPVPVKVVSTETVGPSVGEKAIYSSVVGGLVGLFLVCLFMLLNYKKLGLISVISLILYGLITLTIYKVVPITLTLSGVAGFILSIGMAVDSNILIFESIKDKLSAGYSKSKAYKLGFYDAWNSIKDANIVTLIIAFILFNPLEWGFLLNSGPVRGFAATLGVGVLVSLFTGVYVTKTVLFLFSRRLK